MIFFNKAPCYVIDNGTQVGLDVPLVVHGTVDNKAIGSGPNSVLTEGTTFSPTSEIVVANGVLEGDVLVDTGMHFEPIRVKIDAAHISIKN